MTIREPILFVGQKEKRTLTVLFDSGASHSCIDKSIAEAIATILPIEDNELAAETADKNHSIKILGQVGLKFIINNVPMWDLFFVIENLADEAIIGAATLQKYRIVLDFEHDKVRVNPSVGRIQII